MALMHGIKTVKKRKVFHLKDDDSMEEKMKKILIFIIVLGLIILIQEPLEEVTGNILRLLK